MMNETELYASLLKSREPSIQWRTRVRVLGEPPTARPIRSLQQRVRDSSRVRTMLANIGRPGPDGGMLNVYWKWHGAHWVVAALPDLGYPAGDQGLAPLRDALLDQWVSPHYRREVVATSRSTARRKPGVPKINGRFRRCASQQGNALLALVRLGLTDARLGELAELLGRWQWPDGGWNCDVDPEASHSSFHETLLPMRGLWAYWKASGDRDARATALRASELFLRRKLFRRLSDGAVIHPNFVRLHYPAYWHYDVLAGLVGMAELGRVRDPRCAEALDLLESKRRRDGGWSADACYYRRADRPGTNTDSVDWGARTRGGLNEWVTTEALAVLRTAGRLDARFPA